MTDRDLSAVETPVGNNAALHVQRSAPDRQEEREEPQKSFHPPTGITTTHSQTQTRNRRTDGSNITKPPRKLLTVFHPWGQTPSRPESVLAIHPPESADIQPDA